MAIDPRPDPEELSHAPTSQVPRIHDSCHNYSYYVDRMNALFPCDHGAATHSRIMHDTGRGTLCKNANGCREGTGEIQDCGDMWPDW